MRTQLFPVLAALASSTCFAFSFKNLVAFGDSYTDNVVIDFSRSPRVHNQPGLDTYTQLRYLLLLDRTAWPDFVAQYSKGKVSTYDFAHAGGTCSNKLTPRIYKPVLEAAIPEYEANVTTKLVGRPSQKTTYIKSKNGTYVPLASQDTLYSIWIGTNDVGAGLLLTDPLPNVSIVNTTACVFDWMQELYDHGARNFLIQNVSKCHCLFAFSAIFSQCICEQMIPLYLLPMYSAKGYNTKFYLNVPHNQTEWSIFIAELVRSGNELQNLRAQYVAPSRFPGARIGWCSPNLKRPRITNFMRFRCL